ncbi:PAS domain-containing protein [Roseomonas sp. USHLN139]|uniref:PAS domain-containing protein n=1 Tax=Roseomonas sp. USHLN139 TaxID=3081298 RepID=UPI003B024AFF
MTQKFGLTRGNFFRGMILGKRSGHVQVSDQPHGRSRPTGRESAFADNEIIVTKTDTAGRIRYANPVFLRVSALKLEETLGRPHSIIRHPDMPRAIFRLMWDTIRDRQEFFGYILNLAKNGDHYWVFAHVTASFGRDGSIVGFHSNRRRPSTSQVSAISSIYADILAAERRHSSPSQALAAGSEALNELLSKRRMRHDEFAFAI